MTETRAAREPTVLAVLAGPGTERPVMRMAALIARLVGGDVAALRLAAELSPRGTTRQVMRALEEPGTVYGILASDAGSRPFWQDVALRSATPVVLVPPARAAPPSRFRRVLLPLDGTARSAAAVAALACELAREGAELVVLHVFDAATVPKFWDQHAHAGPVWEQEFLARNCALPGARLELRRGTAAEHVVKVAGTEQADLIALAWSQRLQPGRALVVRRAVLDTGVPVLLVPTPLT